MPLDDIDRRLAQRLTADRVLASPDLGQLAQRADAEGRTFTRVVCERLRGTPSAGKVLATLRSLHAGFEATDETALDRHEDRLVGRLALRVGALDEATARAAIAEQEARRARGQHARLGELLVEQGRVDPSTAERLYRQLENAVVICHECFAPNTRGSLAVGASFECPRCGSPVTVPPPAAKPGWSAAIGPQSDVVLDEAAAVATELPSAAEPEGKGVSRRLVAQKRRRPNLAPEEKRSSRIVAMLAVVGVLVVLVGVIIAWRISQPSEGQLRFERFRELLAVARSQKAGGSIEEAARTYETATALFVDVKPPADGEAAVAQARADAALCADFAKRAAKMTSDGDATPLSELAKTCEDKDVLNELVNRLVHSKDQEAAAGLVALADSKDEDVRRRAREAALMKGGTPILPLIEKLLASDDAASHRDALVALLRVQDRAAIPTLEKALERFPKEDAFWLSAAQLLTAIKDPAGVPLLKRLAHDERTQVWEAAILGLTKIAPQESVAEIVQGLDASLPVQTASLAELQKAGERAVPALRAALEKGQASAALPLIAIASPKAIAAIVETLPKLPWDKRGSVLEALCGGTAPTGWLSAVVGTIVNEAREGLSKKDPKLTRTVLEQVVLAAKSFGFPEAANEIKFELRFIELADRSPLPIDEKNLDVSDQKEPGARLELRNFTEARLVLYARGPEHVELHAVSGTESGKSVAPGTYDVWVARVADDGREVEPAHGSLDVVAGKVTAVQYGTRPDPDEASRLLARAKTDEPPPPDESEADRLKRIFDRGFRAEQLVDEARKTLLTRVKDESPWPREQEVLEKTAHYRVLSDAGAETAKKVGVELEAAYEAYGKLLSAPADVASSGFVVRFFKQKSDYDAWRTRTSLQAIVTEALSKDRKIPARTRALAERGKDADPKFAERLQLVADALEKAAGVDEIAVENLEELDDELTRSEKVTEARALGRALQRAYFAVQGTTLLAAAAGRSPHGTILGHYNDSSRELCLFQVENWERTLRHEAFHQFLFAHAAKAPSWLHEGMATYFEALSTHGKNEERIAELKRAHESGSILDNLKLTSLLATEKLDSLDYAIAWSFVYYLVEQEPAVLGRILARAREGKASTFAIVSAFDDLLKTEEQWQKATRKLVLGG